MRTSDIVRQLWCEFYSRHCEGWVSWFGAKQDMCAAVKNRRVVQRGETMPCLTGAGATTECLCKAGEFVVVVWSWWRGQGGMRSRRREKKFGALVREAGVCQATEASVVLPEVVGLFIDEE